METVSDEEANCAISDGTKHVLAYKIKERLQHCPNAWRQHVSCRLSNINELLLPLSVASCCVFI
jgi:hypothetical protein